jgi:hypothetical protein
MPFGVSKRIFPVVYFAGGEGSNCNMDREVTDLPDPLSPTSASVSPLLMLNEIFLTAVVVEYSLTKSIDRFSMERSEFRFEI